MNIKKIISVVSVLFFLLSISLNKQYSLIIYTPLIFAVFSFVILPNKINFGPGVTMVFCVMFIRYIISPFLHSIVGFSGNIHSEAFYTSFYLIHLEMIIILISINFFTWRQKKFIYAIKYDNFTYNNYSYLLPIIFVGISIVLSIKDSAPLNRYNFIINDSVEMTVADLEEVTTGLPRILNYTHFLLLATLFFYYFKKYKLTKKKKYIFIGCFAVIILSSFYTDQSRNSMLLPYLTLLFMAIKFYPQYRKKIIVSFTSIILFSMTILSFLKFFKVKDVSTDIIQLDFTAKLFDSYFAGYGGVLKGVENIDYIKSNIDSATLLNEIFSSTIFIGNYFDLENRSSVFYNDALFSNSLIIPTVIQGYAYFGMFFSCFFIFLIMYLIFYFDRLFYKSNRVDMAFLFAFASVKLGWMHQGNFVIVMTHINYVLVLFIIFKANEFFGKKLNFRRS